MVLAGNTSAGRNIVEGFSVEQLRSLALDWWAEGFRASSTLQDIRVLADELVGLGVLRSVGADRYALRSPNVVTLLGSPEEIEEALTQPRGLAVEFSAATFRSARADGPAWERSPLTISQERRVLERGHGVVVITGTRAAGIDRVPEFLRSSPLVDALEELEEELPLAEVERRIERKVAQGMAVFLGKRMPLWEVGWFERIAQRLAARTSRANFVRAVFLADPRGTWELEGSDPGMAQLEAAGVQIVTLGPWHESALHQYLEDLAVGPLDPELKAIIGERTGFWPAFVEGVGQRAAKGERLATILRHGSAPEPTARQEQASALGLHDAMPDATAERPGAGLREALGVLRALAALESADAADLVAVADAVVQPGPAQGASSNPVTTSFVESVLRWADRLQLARPTERGASGSRAYLLDPFVARLLSS